MLSASRKFLTETSKEIIQVLPLNKLQHKIHLEYLGKQYSVFTLNFLYATLSLWILNKMSQNRENLFSTKGDGYTISK